MIDADFFATPVDREKNASPSLTSYPGATPRRRGRPTKEERAEIDAERAELRANETKRQAAEISVSGLMAGADYAQLAALFGMPRKEVLRRLEHCPKHRYLKHNHPVFLIRQAAPYLCDPIDIETRIRMMNPDDLPRGLQEWFYRGIAARRKSAEDAARLVRVEYVVSVLSDVLGLLRTATQQVIEDEVTAGKLDTETINRLQRKRDDMLADIHKQLMAMQTESATPTIADDGWDGEPDLQRDDETTEDAA